MTEIPHFSLPFRFKSVGAAMAADVVEQDSIDEIFACVEAVLRYEIGQRLSSPDFGISPLVFQSPGPNMDQIRAQVAQWEPRAELLIQEYPDRFDELISHVIVDVQSREEAAL